MKFFGFYIGRQNQIDLKTKAEQKQAFSTPFEEDGAFVIDTNLQGGGLHTQHAINFYGDFNTEIQLIQKYRSMAEQPEIEAAIEDIVSETIVMDESESVISLDLTKTKLSDNIKQKINEEYENLLQLLEFNKKGHEIFRRWYIDGRLYYHLIIDKEHPKDGIQEIIALDPLRIQKIKEQKKDNRDGVELVVDSSYYYIYKTQSMNAVTPPAVGPNPITTSNFDQAIKIYPDTVAYINSGKVHPVKKHTISFLDKAIRPLNQLRMIEDCMVIYLWSRAPERRIFYIDTGNLPKIKAEQYMVSIMNQYRNKVIYDAQSGEIKDDRKFPSILEDFWIPRKEGGKGTEITTLQGGYNLSNQSDWVEYFLTKLYKALNVPSSRMESTAGFNLGRSSEISRDELKFSRFISRLRNRFSDLFVQLLRVQLLSKQIITQAEWEGMKNKIHFNFARDSFFAELKNNEIMQERLNMYNTMQPLVGKYFSEKYVRNVILRQTDEDIRRIDSEIQEEGSDITYQQNMGMMPPGDDGEFIDGSFGSGQMDPNLVKKMNNNDKQPQENEFNQEQQKKAQTLKKRNTNGNKQQPKQSGERSTQGQS